MHTVRAIWLNTQKHSVAFHVCACFIAGSFLRGLQRVCRGIYPASALESAFQAYLACTEFVLQLSCTSRLQSNTLQASL